MFDAGVDRVINPEAYKNKDAKSFWPIDDDNITGVQTFRELLTTTRAEADVIGFLDNLIQSDGVDVDPKSGEIYFVKDTWKYIYHKYVYTWNRP
jgi:hypothetical protein